MSQRKIRLRTFFLQYLILFMVGSLLLIIFIFGCFAFGLHTGVILKANYVEDELAEHLEEIRTSSDLSIAPLPELATYVLFSSDGTEIAGTMDRKKANYAWKTRNKVGEQSIWNVDGYSYIEREQELLVVQYKLVPKFKYKGLRSLDPQLIATSILICSIVMFAFLLAVHYGRRLSRNMTPLSEIVGKIRNQDLDFAVHTSEIVEMNDILQALERLKEELGSSLKQQWELERSRNEWIAALAHDIKTPLTMIRGNAELLSEYVNDKEKRPFIHSVLKGSSQIERYVQELLDIARMQSQHELQLERIESNQFIAGLEEDLNALSAEKGLTVKMIKQPIRHDMKMDRERFLRAILNVTMNAIRYSPENGELTLHVWGEREFDCITVQDSGPGFSNEDLQKGMQPFYRNEQARPNDEHYGLGLYITNTIVRAHGGMITLENTKQGAKVTLKIPAFSLNTEHGSSNMSF